MSTGLSAAAPQRHPEVVMGAPLRRGENVVHYVKDPRTGWYFQMGSREFFLLSQMDGERSLAEIGSAYAERFGRRLTDAHWESLLGMLRSRHLLVEPEPEPDVTAVAQGDGPAGGAAPVESLADARQRADRERRAGRRRLLYARFPLFNPDPFLSRLAPRAGFLFSRWFVVPALVVSLTALGLAVADLPELWRASRMNVGHPLAAVSFGTIWLVVALHETAHGLASRRFGGAVAEMGVLWRFPLLTPYCKTDDVVLFARRRHRVYTAFAGVFVNLLALVPFTAAWHFTTAGTHAHALAGSLLMFGSLTVVMNLVPMLRLDGYFMLNHAVGLADLRAETYRFWLARLRREPALPYPRRDRMLYTFYGLATFALLAAVLTGIVGIWYWSLERWIGAAGAVALLSAEAVLLVAVVIHLRRRRARRGDADGSTGAGAADQATTVDRSGRPTEAGAPAEGVAR